MVSFEDDDWSDEEVKVIQSIPHVKTPYGIVEFWVHDKKLLKTCFEDWKIAYDCLTDPESSDEETKFTRYVETLKNPKHGMDGFIGGIFRFISFHFCFVLETQLNVINA